MPWHDCPHVPSAAGHTTLENSPYCMLILSVFLPAADIPRFVALGSVALGITGQDMIAESTHADQIAEILPLGFGKCSLQVQVPVKSPFSKVEDLVGKRVATSFEVLAGELFTRLDKEGQAEQRTQVEYVGGSVEAACALGMADGIGESPFFCLMHLASGTPRGPRGAARLGEWRLRMTSEAQGFAEVVHVRGAVYRAGHGS